MSSRFESNAGLPQARPWWHYFIVAVTLIVSYAPFELTGAWWIWRPHAISPLTILCFFFGYLILNKLEIFPASAFSRIAGWLLVDAEKDGDSGGSRISLVWLATGFFFVGGMLLLLERMQPMYFTRDDNTVQFLPMMIYGGRSLSHGNIPQWNPWQFMGAATSAEGIYALTYPLTYLAYLFASTVLHNEFLTLEIFVIAHLLLSYPAVYWMARCYGIRSSLAAAAALCTTLSGFSLIVTRNWYYMAPVVLYAPLALGAFGKLIKARPHWKWSLVLGAMIGMFFHAGNVQMWSYLLSFLAIATILLLLARALPLLNLLLIGASLIVGLGISLPLLWVQLEMTKGVIRSMAWYVGGVLRHDAPAFLLPGSWLHIFAATDWGPGSDPSHGAEMIYSGTFFVFATLIICILFLFYRFRRTVLAANIWALCAGVAFLLTLGRDFNLWWMLTGVPGFDKFRVAFKFVGYVVIFSSLGGAIVIERLMSRFRAPRWLEPLFFSAVLLLMTIHCIYSRGCFYEYGFKYQPLDPTLATYLKPKNGSPVRFAPLIPIRSVANDYAKGLPLDLPTLHQVYSVSGLDGLADWVPSYREVVSRMERHPLSSFHEYGVRYVLIHRLTDEVRPGDGLMGIERILSFDRALERAARQNGDLVYKDASIELIEMKGGRPLAFATANPDKALPVRFDEQGATVDASEFSAPGELVINVFWRPEFVALADGRALSVTHDGWGRVIVSLAAPAKSIILSFQPHWTQGILLGALVTGFGVLLIAVIQSRFELPAATGLRRAAQAQHFAQGQNNSELNAPEESRVERSD